MKASVILPVHNKAPYLQACLDSVFAQTHADFELIAVDDASTDGSAAILAACPDPRLRVITLRENVGPGPAAQRAMDEARGEYLLRVDADDVQRPERFARQVAFLDAHPEVGALGAAVRLIGEGDPVRQRPQSHAACAVELLFGVALYQPTLALRRRVLMEHGIRYHSEWPRVGEDWLLQLELARVTRLANLPEVLVRYRMEGQGISQGRDKARSLADLHARALRHFGHTPPTTEQLRLHGLVEKSFPVPPDARQLEAFHTWLEHLRAWGRRSGAFDPAVLDARLDRAWDELLHHLPQFGWPTTRAYLRLGAHPSPRRLYYLLRAFLTPGGPKRWTPL